MARADRPPGLTPERRAARLFVERFDLAMPVDIRGVVDGLADVTDVAFPNSVNCDAVVFLDHKPPTLFLNSSRPRSRRRFTLAHELGHVMLAWHAGPSVCEPLQRLWTPGNSGTEGEANIFASEVLVPRRELEVLQGPEAVAERLVLAGAADISDEARLRAVADSLDPGYAFVLCDDTQTVRALTVSPGTHTPTPYPGDLFDELKICKDADDYGRAWLASYSAHWWYLAPPNRAHRQDVLSSSELLDVILREMATVSSDEAATSARRSLAGIIGSAFSASKAETTDDLVAVFRQRFVGRDGLRFVIEHELFNAYLWSRADELAERRAMRRGRG